ncbi:DUF317 domain-containing protein [Kitasatospora sp. A2-31]|uniref:DUF317 domain-containing protein n=1 Tax=Kitasatospora sp. A2-31 TaxID=2916414 RepID=UPI001EE9C041|nr:DUF317 domain-containing protein [Kitasatospora sp. A2-31]MCG6497002.1 DUF317 domain-containing protein [Kitasatospora sp. A2-31]
MIDVTPRYLAGRDYSNQVFDRLVTRWGWGRADATELSQTFAWSRDHRFRLGAGQLDPGAWWRIAAAKEPLGPPDWQAGFSQETPPEIILAVAEELARTGTATDWTGESHPALRTPTDRRALIRTLADAGWRSTYRAGALDLEAPDHLARVQIRLDPRGDQQDLMGRPHLYVEVGPRDTGGYPPYWQAMVTTNAPTVVVDALAQALTDPTALQRDRDWMDEELLAHLGHTEEGAFADADPQIPEPGEAAHPYTETDRREAAAEVCEEALEWTEDLDHTPDGYIEDRVIPSSRTGTPTTWGQLPPEQKALAYLLVEDMVIAAAASTPALFDLDPGANLDPRTASKKPTPPLTTALNELTFTIDDLKDAAAHAAAMQINWVDPSGLADTLHDRPIAAAADGTGPTWGSLPDAQREQAFREVDRLLTRAAERTTELFAADFRPAPLALVSPVYLAGPGHDRTAAAKPLTDRGWTTEEHGDITVYTSPCRRLRAQSTTDDNGTTWTASFNSLLSGEEVWRASADRRTPPEIVAALHTALAASPGELVRPSGNAEDGLAPVIAAGWHDTSTREHLMWDAPDAEVASVYRCTAPAGQMFAGESRAWQISTGKLGPGEVEGWSIEMSENIPAPLLEAVTAAMTDPAPVARLGRDLTPEHLVDLVVRPLVPQTPPGPSARVLAARTRIVLSPPAATTSPSANAASPPDPPRQQIR